MNDPEILLMFSGGLDSTVVFYKLAVEERKTIHVHHMHLKNVENRHLVESKAVSNVKKYIGDLGGSFTYSESTHVYPAYNNQFILDSYILSFMAGTICSMMPSVKYVAYGMTATDLNSQALNSRLNISNIIFGALCGAKKIYPVKNMDKKDLIKAIPQELAELTWSCRTPMYKNNTAISCGTCRTCKELDEAGIVI